MEITQIKAQIKSKTPDNFYIFTGDEIAVMDIYIKKLAECKDLEIVRVDTVADIYGKMQNRSFIQKSYCYVIRDDKEFMTNEKAWESIKQVVGNNILILLVSSLDKRGKFYKHYKSTITVFEPLNESILIKYIQKEINMSKANCQRLIEICESDYSRILLEIDKIITYFESIGRDNEKMNADESFEELLNQGVTYQPPKDAIFDFVDAFLKGKVKTSLDLLQQSYAVGESTIVLLSVLYNNVKQVLMVQECGNKDIPKTTGLTGWQIKCAKEKMGYWSTDDLIYFLKLIRKVEKGIKSGFIEDSIAMDYIIVNMF